MTSGLNDGTSDLQLPVTGFSVGLVTRLPAQLADKTYDSFSDLWLEIPKLAVSTPIVSVPLSKDEWDVSWLNETAFPTWAGNSVITAHVWDELNQPGIFQNLKRLEYGDEIKVQTYTYRRMVRAVLLRVVYQKSLHFIFLCQNNEGNVGKALEFPDIYGIFCEIVIKWCSIDQTLRSNQTLGDVEFCHSSQILTCCCFYCLEEKYEIE
jgi:hypothetical protein